MEDNFLDQQELRINVRKAFGNLYRKRCALVAVENEKGNILIGAKPYFYPPTISRLLGGGIDEGENLELGTIRELKEELGVQLDKSLITPLLLFDTYATDQEGRELHNETYVYHAKAGKLSHQAGDDVKFIIELTLDELYELGQRYEALPETLWYQGPEGEFCWADYAKLYGPLHKLVAQRIKALR